MQIAPLQGQQLLIVGGSSGMGLGTAQLADAYGADVIIASHSEEKLAQALGTLSSRAKAIPVDLTQESSIRQLLEQIPPLDHLLITAGPGSRSKFLEDPLQTARDYLEGKFWSAYVLTRYAVPKLRHNGSVTFVSGGYAIRPEPGSVPTTAAQNAIEGLAKALAVELAPRRFNVIRPGMINTSLWDFMEAEERKKMMAEAAGKIPVGRVGTAEDIAQAAVFLMTNGFISGSVLNVDGGMFLR